MKLAWGARVSDAFRRKAIAIAVQHGLDPSDLMAAMAFETGKTFSPSIKNPRSGATGLIQFMPSTARGMGTTTEALAKKTAEEQLDDVEQYLRPFLGRLRTLEDLYMSILWPAAVGQPNDYVLFEEGGSAYAQNRELDVDGDRKITKAEATAFVRMRLEEGLRAPNVLDIDDTQPAAPIEDRGMEMQPEKNMEPFSMIALASTLIQSFAPLLRAKADKALGSEVGGPLVDSLIGLAKAETGKQDPMEAVAVARQNPAIVAKLEQATEDWFKSMTPAIDKIAQLEQMGWAADEASKDSAARRAVEGGFDVRPLLAQWGVGAMTVLLLALAGVMLAYVLSDKDIPELLMGLFITVATWIMAKVSTMYDYGYGTSRSSAGKDAVIDELASRRGQK